MTASPIQFVARMRMFKPIVTLATLRRNPRRQRLCFEAPGSPQLLAPQPAAPEKSSASPQIPQNDIQGNAAAPDAAACPAPPSPDNEIRALPCDARQRRGAPDGPAASAR